MVGREGGRGGRRSGAGRPAKFDVTTPLSRALREIRLSAGLSGADLGDALGASYMKVSRIESGTAIPDIEGVDEWLRACRATRRRKEILELRQDRVFASKRKWDDEIDVVAAQEEVGRIVSSVDEILSYCDFTIPGLLQTPEYTAALFRLAGVLDTRALEKSIAVRQGWRAAALKKARSLRFVIGEAAMRRPFGSALPAQLEALVIDGQRKNVDIRVLDSDVPTRIIPMHSFTVFGDKLVTIETFVRTITLREKRDIESFREIFDRLAKDARPLEPTLVVAGKAQVKVKAGKS